MQGSLLRSAGGDDDEGKGRSNVPKGFEKILKRTKRGIKHEDNNEEKSASEEDSKKEEEKEEKEQSDGEQEDEKEEKK